MVPSDSVLVSAPVWPSPTFGLSARDPALRAWLSHPESGIGRLRGRSHGSAARRFAVAAFDAAQVCLVGVSSALVFAPVEPVGVLGLPLLASLLALLLRRAARSSADFRRLTVRMVGRRSAHAVIGACGILFAVSACLSGLSGASALVPWFVAWSLASATASYLIRVGRGFSAVTERAIRPTVAIVGEPEAVSAMNRMLALQGTHAVVASFDASVPGDLEVMEALAASGRVDRVVVVGCLEAVVDQVCLMLSDTPTLVCIGLVTPTMSLLVGSGLHGIRHPPFLPLLPNPLGDWRGILKRGFDLASATGLLLLLLPLMAIVAAAIRLESPGPVLFRQWRFGVGSRPTLILKFRTMRHDLGDATGAARTLARDPRVTRLGRLLRRTSIDELPQLLNVLRGDMSLVGPRPHAMHMKVDGDYYFELVRHYRLRHRVKPGITGWAQVTGSRGVVDTIEKAVERVDKDIWYVRNWSLGLDLRILLRTALGGFLSRDAD